MQGQFEVIERIRKADSFLITVEFEINEGPHVPPKRVRQSFIVNAPAESSDEEIDRLVHEEVEAFLDREYPRD